MRLLIMLLCVCALCGSESSPDVRAIVVLGSPKLLLSEEQKKSVSGVQFREVDVPGKPIKVEKQLRAYLGQPLTTPTIDKIKSTITTFYADNDHPLILLQVPEQDITDGILQLIILESCLGRVCIEGNQHFSTQSLRDCIKLQTGDYIDEKTLVRNLNLINRNPFRHADFLYSPGLGEATTDLILSVDDRRPLRFYAGYENTGVASTGHNRFYTGLNWGNAFNLGHIFGYQYTSSNDFHAFQAHTGQYIAPLSWGHVLTLFGGYSTVNAVLDEFDVADASGNMSKQQMKSSGFATQLSGRYLVPVFLSRYLLHDLVFGYDWKRTNNNVIFGDEQPPFGKNVNLTQFVLGYVGDYDRTNFRLDFETNFFFSPGQWISDQTNTDYASLVPKAKNKWLYWRSAFAYLQRIPKDFSYFLKVEGQIASANLLPSEQFGLGGWDTVRGYDQRAVNKENALLVSTELRSPPLPIWSKKNRKPSDGFQVLGFWDYGYGSNKFGAPPAGSTPTEPKNLWLMGIGPGFRYTMDPYFTARLDWGFKMHTSPFVGRRGQMVHFNMTASY